MFERYTEMARRVIFFARYASSEYGSPTIESEHLLLGVLKEDGKLVQHFLEPPGTIEGIGKEIEAESKMGKRFAASAELPLSAEAKRILLFSAEEAHRLDHEQIGTEHLLLGILREEKCLAARILGGHGVKPGAVREGVAEGAEKARIGQVVDGLLGAWQERDAEKAAGFFGEHGQFWDGHGERWVGRAEIRKGVEGELALFGKSMGGGDVKDVKFVGMDAAVVTIAWEAKAALKKRGASGLRMVVLMARGNQGWCVASAHLAEIRARRRGKS
jgi:uncharacterized protein (TIGR02246 family)